MALLVPAIYSPRYPDARLPWIGRLIGVGVAAACLAVLMVATQITPDPAGMGTHTELGLSPCPFPSTTGYPCPTCGMTTSFSWFVRGHFAGSVYVQPMGFLLALTASVIFCISAYIACSGRAIHRHLLRLPLNRVFWTGAVVFVLAWGWKIWIHQHGMDGWS